MNAYDVLTLLFGTTLEDVETDASGEVTSVLLRLRCRRGSGIKLFDSITEPKHAVGKGKTKRRK